MYKFFRAYTVLRNVQNKPYADKPNAFGLSVHSFVSYERIGKWDEDRYRKGAESLILSNFAAHQDG